MIKAADMGAKLLPLDKLGQRFSAIEPLEMVDVSLSDLHVTLPDGWNVGLKEKASTALTDATVLVDGESHLLRKSVALDLTSSIGLTREYVAKCPSNLLQPHVDYWMSQSDKAVRLAMSAGVVTAVARPAVVPLPNADLLAVVLEGFQKKYGKDVEVVADYKVTATMDKTAVRLIVPEESRKIDSAREDDQWSLGLDIRNSLTGKSPLTLSGYMFAWWCTNGAISTHASSGNYNRKTQGQDVNEMLDWARQAVDEILGGLEHELDAVQELTTIQLGDDVAAVLQDVFTRYKVPIKQREGIMDRLLDSDDLTMYGLMQAITSGANDIDLDPAIVQALMTIGGDLPAVASSRCTECHRIAY